MTTRRSKLEAICGRFARSAVLAALLAGVPGAATADEDPATFRTSGEIEQELAKQVETHQKAVREAQRLKDELRQARDAHRQQLTAIEPWWRRAEEYKRKLAQLDAWIQTKALTELTPEVEIVRERLRQRAQLREATGGPMPPDEARDRELLAQVESVVAAARRDLPAMRPSFVPAGTG